MKIRTEPLLGGAAFSFVILLVVNIISIMVVMGSMQQMIETVLSPTFDPNMPPNSLFPTTLWGILGCLGCITPLIAGIGAGVIYARQHAKIEPITGSLVGGGAASGALGFFLSGIVAGIMGGLMTIPMMNQLSALDPSLSAAMGPTAGIGIITSLFYGVCYGVVYAVFGAILGIIGAAVGVPKSAKPAAA